MKNINLDSYLSNDSKWFRNMVYLYALNRNMYSYINLLYVLMHRVEIPFVVNNKRCGFESTINIRAWPLYLYTLSVYTFHILTNTFKSVPIK